MKYFEHTFRKMNSLVDNPTRENKEMLKQMLLIKDEGTYEKHFIPYYCSRLFLCFGKDGIFLLKEILTNAPGRIYPTAIIETLFLTSMKKHNNLKFVDPSNSLLKYPEITEEMAEFAKKVVHELVTESLTNPSLFSNIVQSIYLIEHTSYQEDLNPQLFSRFVLNIFTESTIKINKSIIDDFKEIITNPNSREEDCQEFLKQHPVLIDPLAKEIIPKQRLGVEFITDFVVRKLNDEYLLVEIEKPSTPIFTKSNDFTSQFSHALGQVLDFQEWVESNIAYAEKLMPGITAPSGILILGLCSQLDQFQKRKLRRFNLNNNGKIKVLTFDEVLGNSTKLYSNILGEI